MSVNPAVSSYLHALRDQDISGEKMVVFKKDHFEAVFGKGITATDLKTTEAAKEKISKQMERALGDETESLQVVEEALVTVLAGDKKWDGLRELKSTSRDEFKTSVKDHLIELKSAILEKVKSIETQRKLFSDANSRMDEIPRDEKEKLLETLMTRSTRMQSISQADATQLSSAYYDPVSGGFKAFNPEGTVKGSQTLSAVRSFNETKLVGIKSTSSEIAPQAAVFMELDALSERHPGTAPLPVLILQPGNNDVRNGAQVYALIKDVQEWSKANGREVSIRLEILGYGGHPTTQVFDSFVKVMGNDQKLNFLKDLHAEATDDEVKGKIAGESLKKFDAAIAGKKDSALSSKWEELKKLPFGAMIDKIVQDDELRATFASSLGAYLPMGAKPSDHIYFMQGTPEAEAFKLLLEGLGSDLDLVFTDSFKDGVKGLQVVIEPYSLHTGMNVANAKKAMGDGVHDLVFAVSAQPSARRQYATFAHQLQGQRGEKHFGTLVGYALPPSRPMIRAMSDSQLNRELYAALAESAREVSYLVSDPFLLPQAFDEAALYDLAAAYHQLFPESGKDAKEVMDKVPISKIMGDLANRFAALELGIEFTDDKSQIVERAKTQFNKIKASQEIPEGSGASKVLSRMVRAARGLGKTSEDIKAMLEEYRNPQKTDASSDADSGYKE